jgi:hypothetical protein
VGSIYDTEPAILFSKICYANCDMLSLSCDISGPGSLSKFADMLILYKHVPVLPIVLDLCCPFISDNYLILHLVPVLIFPCECDCAGLVFFLISYWPRDGCLYVLN